MPKFSSQTYRMVAEVISGYKRPTSEDLTIAGLVGRFNEVFSEDNPQFDLDKFYKACGMDERATVARGRSPDTAIIATFDAQQEL